MERTQLFDLMGELKLYGMKAAFDEIMATAVKRQHEPQRIVGDLLSAEINEKQARSIKYQLTIAKLPLAKDLGDFQFEGTPINETLVNDLAGGGFIAQQRNAVLVGGTGTGKTHLAIAIARSCIRSGSRGRFYNVVDLVNRLETETRNGRQGRIADQLTRMDFLILDELGYLPFAQSGGQLLGVLFWWKIGLEDRLQYQHRCCHADPIAQGRDAQRPKFAVGLRYEHSSDRVRPVGLLPDRKRQFAKPPLHPIRLDVRKILTVYTRCALVGAALGIGMCQNVFTADLVVQGVEAITGFCLRFRVQRRLQFLNTRRSC